VSPSKKPVKAKAAKPKGAPSRPVAKAASKPGKKPLSTPAGKKSPGKNASTLQKPAKKPVTPKIVKKPVPPAAPKISPAETALVSESIFSAAILSASASNPKVPGKPKPLKTTLDDLPLDIDEKDELLEEEKKDLVKVLREDEDEPLETAFVPTDTSERYILVVDEEGQRRNETMTIVSQILPNAVVEVADDPEEALEIMQEADFDTYVVNFLMPGYSASPFVKAVANHPDHPLLIGFAADKISDALDQKKGLKIIPLKRLFDLDVNTESKEKADKDE
jgi:CheY-like chemotaxis protein